MHLDERLPEPVRRILLRYEVEFAAILPFAVFGVILLTLDSVASQIAGERGRSSMIYWEWTALAIPTLAFSGGVLCAAHGLVRLAMKTGWRRLLDLQRSGADIRALPWHQFEQFVAAAFSAHGWKAEVVGKAGPDGGIDIVLTRKKARAIVQCKQRRWQEGFVGEKDVREFVGLIAAEKANRGFFVTSGVFSPEAVGFAAKVPKLELVAADDLFRMLGRCPECGSEMVFKSGSRGPFMSCATFPLCRGSADLPKAA